jgi:hypothetical protein
MTDAQIVAAARAAFDTFYPKPGPYTVTWDTLAFEVKWLWLTAAYRALIAKENGK